MRTKQRTLLEGTPFPPLAPYRAILIALFLFLGASPLQAGGRIGPFEWRGNILVSGTYDDNITSVFDENQDKIVFFPAEGSFDSVGAGKEIDCPQLQDAEGNPLLDDSGNPLRICRTPESDIIVQMQPSLSLMLRKRRLLATLDASLLGSVYTQHSGDLSDIFYFLGLDVRYQATRWLAIEVGDDLRAVPIRRDVPSELDEKNLSQDPTSPDFFNEVSANLVQFNQVYVAPTFQHDFHPRFTETRIQDRLSYGAYLNELQFNDPQQVDTTTQDPEEAAAIDFTNYAQNELDVQLFKARLTRLTIAPQFDWLYNWYQNTSNPHKMRARLDFTAQPVRRLTLTFAPGWEWVFLEGETPNDFVLDTIVQYVLSRRTNVFARYERSHDFSTAKNSTFDDIVAGGFRYQITRGLEGNFSISYKWLSELRVPQSDPLTQEEIAAGQTATREEKEEEILSLGGGLRYTIGKRWTAMLGYTFRKSYGRENFVEERDEATQTLEPFGIFDFPGYTQNRVHLGINYLF
ncbi:MAG: hypothetical protein D6795_06520 [Deltaproteobacteria bacterium]|nr:MAG: hypothetical protein D6795_06520 [Deltaproteobacteria bacterium]